MLWTLSQRLLVVAFSLNSCLVAAGPTTGEPGEDSLAVRIKQYLDSVPAIDTHDHLWPFESLPGYAETDKGRGMTLAGIWRSNYFSWMMPLTPWKRGSSFEEWWQEARDDFQDARATGFYRYMLPAFQDLYGVDFNRITDEEASRLNDAIFENYRNPQWLYQVVTERANIELMFIDRHWARLDFSTNYPWEVLVFNVGPLVRGFHPSEFDKPSDDPYLFAAQRGIKVETLDDYLSLLDQLFATAKSGGAATIKSTLAYRRSLRFEEVPKARAERVFGRPRQELSQQEIRDFEDFIMWRITALSAKYEMPFQIHTGLARIEGSNPMLLVNLIARNPKTKFILFHGGYPWIGETGAIVMRFPRRVWIDSVWLPTISYSAAKRAYHEWLEVMSSDRIMWGTDCSNAEGIYGATELTRRVLAEVLAEKVDRGDLIEEHALRIGRQILRENALKLFPQLQERLWKDTGLRLSPAQDHQ